MVGFSGCPQIWLVLTCMSCEYRLGSRPNCSHCAMCCQRGMLCSKFSKNEHGICKSRDKPQQRMCKIMPDCTMMVSIYLVALAATFCIAYRTRASAAFATAVSPPLLVAVPAGCGVAACKGLLVASHLMATRGASRLAFACSTSITFECAWHVSWL